jgi:hypothetical protein
MYCTKYGNVGERGEEVESHETKSGTSGNLDADLSLLRSDPTFMHL